VGMLFSLVNMAFSLEFPFDFICNFSLMSMASNSSNLEMFSLLVKILAKTLNYLGKELK